MNDFVSPRQSELIFLKEALNEGLLVDLVKEHVTDLLAVIDTTRQRVWHNDAYSATLGFTREELEGEDSLEKVHPDDVSKIIERFDAAMAMEAIATEPLEYRMQHRNGHWLTLESRARTAQVPGFGKCLVIVARDITQKKALEQRLKDELADAARYAEAVLPNEIENAEGGGIQAHWRFKPCSALGGDSFNYRFVDDDHFVFGLIDVCGHGVGAALLSISVINVLRSCAMPDLEFTNPGKVLTRLNEVFPMEENGDQFFTLWYGAYHISERKLKFANAGHPPPALILGKDKTSQPRALTSKHHGPVIGMLPDIEYTTEEVAIEPDSILYLFSDGVFEICSESGDFWSYEEFLSTLGKAPAHTASEDLDQIFESCQSIAPTSRFEDDYSLVRIQFP